MRTFGYVFDSPVPICMTTVGDNPPTSTLFDTSEEQRFVTDDPFENIATEDYRMEWLTSPFMDPMGINSLLQIGGRLNSGSASYENRRDPGACCNQQS